jgi:hypothetical protein
LVVDIINDEELYVGVVSTFVARVTSMMDEARKKQSIPSNFKIKQIQVGWKGWIDILRSLSERCSPLEDIKNDTFFNINDATIELGGPPLIRSSTLITVDDLDLEVSKLKDKWVGEFDSLSYFYDKNFRTWTTNYVNLNSNILNIVIK